MAGVFHKAMVWLGLAPDDEYDDYPYDPGMRSGPAPRPPMQQRGGPPPQPRGPMQPQPRPQQPHPQYGYEEEGFVSPRPPQGRPSGTVRQIPPRGGAPVDPRDQRYDNPTVRPMRSTSAKPAEISPSSFDDAKDLADRFKAEQPVVMDLSGLDRELARRLIDFSSGVCYALGGSMERIRPGGYLLIPPSVEVSDEERRRLSGR